MIFSLSSYSLIFIPLVLSQEYNKRDPVADDELSVFPVCATDADCRNISQQASADYSRVEKEMGKMVCVLSIF